MISDVVEAALTADPTPATAIWRKVDCWAPTTVKKELDILVAAGRAVRTQDTTLTGCVRHLYAKRASVFRNQQGGAHACVTTGNSEIG